MLPAIADEERIMFRYHDPQALRALFPRIGVDGDRCVVPNTLASAMILRNLGVDAPSPILSTYRWPGRFKPMPQQRETAAFCTLNPRAFVLNEMGTGKTASALWAIDWLLVTRAIQRVLILCPLSTVTAVWMQEFRNVLLHRQPVLLRGSAAKRASLLSSDPQIVVSNYDVVRTETKALALARFDLIVVDEGDAIKNHNTALHKALRSISPGDGRRWLLTATPVSKSPVDAYGLLKWVAPTRVGGMTAFRDELMLQVAPHRWVPKRDAYDRVYGYLQPAIRITRDSCMSLPALMIRNCPVGMTPEQKRCYMSMRDSFVADADGETITAANAAVKVTKLLQIAQGFIYDSEGNTVSIDCTPRKNMLLDMVREADHKVLIYVPFKAAMDMVYRWVASVMPTAMVNGDTPSGDRAKIFAAFQDQDEPRALVLHPRVAAHGLTLTRATLTIWYGPIHSDSSYQQANGRMNRPGQKHKMIIANIASTKLEVAMFKMRVTNRENQHTLLELYRSVLTTPVV